MNPVDDSRERPFSMSVNTITAKGEELNYNVAELLQEMAYAFDDADTAWITDGAPPKPQWQPEPTPKPQWQPGSGPNKPQCQPGSGPKKPQRQPGSHPNNLECQPGPEPEESNYLSLLECCCPFLSSTPNCSGNSHLACGYTMG